MGIIRGIDTFCCLFLLLLLILLSYMYFFDILSFIVMNPIFRPNFEDKKGQKRVKNGQKWTFSKTPEKSVLIFAKHREILRLIFKLVVFENAMFSFPRKYFISAREGGNVFLITL